MEPSLKKRKKTLTVQLPCAAVTPEMAKQVRAAAKKHETSVSEIIRYALGIFLSGDIGITNNNLQRQSKSRRKKQVVTEVVTS